MRLRAMITATEGIAALERLVASAESELLLCLTDARPETALVEPRLRERGLQTWSDLIAWSARKDVALRLMIGEPDPLMSPLAHRRAWAQASGFANVVSRDAQVICAPHGQRAGPLWRNMNMRRMSRAMAALKAEDPSRLTPVQRQILTTGAAVRAAQVQQSFAIADGKTAVLGAFALEGDNDPTTRAEPRLILTDDSDFSAALRAHFAQSWNDALDAGAQSLASRAAAFDTRVRAQSRPDLRVLRTVAAPAPGAMRLLPEPAVGDLARVLPAALATAQHYVYLESTVLRDASLVEALANASVLSPQLQLIVVLPEALPPIETARDWDDVQARALQQRTLERLQRGFGARMALLRPRHARICGTVVIVDDSLAVMGPFGLSPRSLNTDTGAAVGVRDTEKVAGLMTRLGQRWTGDHADDALRLAQTWQQAAAEEDSALLPHHAPKAAARVGVLNRLPEAFF